MKTEKRSLPHITLKGLECTPAYGSVILTTKNRGSPSRRSQDSQRPHQSLQSQPRRSKQLQPKSTATPGPSNTPSSRRNRSRAPAEKEKNSFEYSSDHENSSIEGTVSRRRPLGGGKEIDQTSDSGMPGAARHRVLEKGKGEDIDRPQGDSEEPEVGPTRCELSGLRSRGGALTTLRAVIVTVHNVDRPWNRRP